MGRICKRTFSFLDGVLGRGRAEGAADVVSEGAAPVLGGAPFRIPAMSAFLRSIGEGPSVLSLGGETLTSGGVEVEGVGSEAGGGAGGDPGTFVEIS